MFKVNYIFVFIFLGTSRYLLSLNSPSLINNAHHLMSTILFRIFQASIGFQRSNTTGIFDLYIQMSQTILYYLVIE